jgi:chorismate mutase/prephenate dehydratase
MRRYTAICFLSLVLFAQEDTELSRALKPSRQRIDQIDDQIVKLLNERAIAVREVGQIKMRFHAPASAPGREEEVLRRLSEQARPPLKPEAVRKIYQAVMSEMTAMEDRQMHSQAK